MFRVLHFIHYAGRIKIYKMNFFSERFMIRATNGRGFERLVATTRFVGGIDVGPQFMGLRFDVNRRAVAVRAFSVISFVNTAIAPSVRTVFFRHDGRRNADRNTTRQHHIRVNRTTNNIVGYTALGDNGAFNRRLFTTISRAYILHTMFRNAAESHVVVLFI